MRLLFFPVIGFSRRKLRTRLQGKRVLITGASEGIGAALAKLIAGPDIRLLLVARSEEKLKKVRSDIMNANGQADIFQCDLRDSEQTASLIQYIHRTGPVDVLVNNAGKSIRRSVFDSIGRLHDFTRTMNLNYFASVHLTLELLPGMTKRRGQIINISAVNTRLIPAPLWAAYQASKTAADQFFRSIGPELEASGVAVTSIYLPLVKTRMIEPTKSYENMPAMTRKAAASLIARSMVTRRRSYAPWWIVPAELASILLRRPLESMMRRRQKKRRKRI